MDLSLSNLNLSVDFEGTTARFRAEGYRLENKLLDVSGQAGLILSLRPFTFRLLPDRFDLGAVRPGRVLVGPFAAPLAGC